ncbi:hypothetical protein H6B15_11195 [Gemmiger formicilis]|uniref:hypothetical protein n=1 Tax=Gemmiger formicilis TaxID=745368 RepID=UPI0019593978|nr:hypothetical protein [Gemmiger formicilis]MBM6717215.1 hypothetical protein [Gemmiger formicilis]
MKTLVGVHRVETVAVFRRFLTPKSDNPTAGSRLPGKAKKHNPQTTQQPQKSTWWNSRAYLLIVPQFSQSFKQSRQFNL